MNDDKMQLEASQARIARLVTALKEALIFESFPQGDQRQKFHAAIDALFPGDLDVPWGHRMRAGDGRNN